MEEPGQVTSATGLQLAPDVDSAQPALIRYDSRGTPVMPGSVVSAVTVYDLRLPYFPEGGVGVANHTADLLSASRITIRSRAMAIDRNGS